jgi:hypothetical protein
VFPANDKPLLLAALARMAELKKRQPPPKK